jgi:hypothetical protein
VEIVSIRRYQSTNREMMLVYIPIWSTTRAIAFKADLLPRDIREAINPPVFLFAKVNTSGIESGHLIIKDFELIPPLEEGEME